MEPSSPPAHGGFTTRAVHAATVPQLTERPSAPPIFPASTWSTDRSSRLADLLNDEVDGYVYGRYDNPTNTALHAVIAALHGAPAAWSFASGMAAIHAAVEATRGDGRILATDSLYGGTYRLFERMTAVAGWRVDAVDLSAPDAIARHATDEHTVVYAETIANPTTMVLDLAALAEQCAERGLALVVDNTFASPYLCRPTELGATLIVESATKFLGGHGDVIAGVVAGDAAAVTRSRDVAIEVGGSLGPFEAWLVARGVQTLALRVERACANAMALAQDLATNERVLDVMYPGLAQHPQHDLAARQFGGRGFGALVTIDLGDRAAAEAFADACEVFLRAASLGGTHSLIIHPASTTHRQLSEADLATAGVGPGYVRLAVGIEDLEDLREDLRQALKVVA